MKRRKKSDEQRKFEKEAVKIIPLGGLDKIGMNITAIEYGNTIVVVDCGISFPEEGMLGIDKIIPDVSYLVQNKEKVKGFVITHGHEDHIGALAYILPQINVPVYATKLTMGLIEHKLKEANLLSKTKRKIIRQGSSVHLGEIRVEFIRTNHSIAGACALAIYTPAGLIVHTGDFKVDYTPLFGESIDLQRLGILGKKGVLAVLSDSTNAMRPGFTPSEVNVAKTMESIFAEHKDRRIIVATFASNVDRVQQIINTASEHKRKVILQGRSMENVIRIAQEMKYMKVPPNTLISIDEMNRYKAEQLVFITTGSQGEEMAALSRMAEGIHRKVKIRPNDVVILSSTPIPGNEKAVSRIINQLEEKGARVINQETHVSGHACQEEIKLIYSLLRPTYAIPFHGDFRQRKAAADLVQAMGTPEENTLLINCGDVLALTKEKADVIKTVPARGVFVDGLGIGDVGNIVIRDRQNLSENGIILVPITIEKESKKVVSGPDIVSRGFVYVRESGDLTDDLKKIARKSIERCGQENFSDWNRLKNTIREDMSLYIWKRLNRNPVILPIVMEV